VLYELAQQEWKSVLSASSIDTKVDNLHQTINEIIDKHCPLKHIKLREDKPPWFNHSIYSLMKARNHAYRKGCPSYLVLKEKVKKAVAASKKKYVNSILNSNTNTKQWWNNLKALNNNKLKPSSQPTKYYIDGKHLSSEEFSSNLNHYFATVGGKSKDPTNSNLTEGHGTGIQCISIGEVKSLLLSIDTTKSTSSQDFPSWVSKLGAEDICVPLHNIINSMLTQQKFPSLWKKAEIIPLPKKSTPSQYNDYRPISLLFHLGKICEQVIINKMKGTLSDCIHNNQYAYQPHISTTDALLDMVDDWTNNLDRKEVKYIQCAFLDFSKAFDRMDHYILTQKMLSFGFNPCLINLVGDFLRNRHHCVRVNDFHSNFIEVTVGAPQGTKLGPMLWLIYVNDLEAEEYSSTKHADDTTFYTPVYSSSGSIEPAVHIAKEWANNNNMLLNEKKTTILNISRCNRSNIDAHISLNNEPIMAVTSAKLLGVYVDNKLSFDSHVTEII
jgi:hypothetical protein